MLFDVQCTTGGCTSEVYARLMELFDDSVTRQDVV